MGDILMSMGILPSRSSDVEAYKDSLRLRSSTAMSACLTSQAVPGRARRAGVQRGAADPDRSAAVRPDDAAGASETAQTDAKAILTAPPRADRAILAGRILPTVTT